MRRVVLMVLLMALATAAGAIKPVRAPGIPVVHGAAGLTVPSADIHVTLGPGTAHVEGRIVFESSTPQTVKLHIEPDAKGKFWVQGKPGTTLKFDKPGPLTLMYEVDMSTRVGSQWRFQLSPPVAGVKPRVGTLRITREAGYRADGLDPKKWNEGELNLAHHEPEGRFVADTAEGVLKRIEMSIYMQGTHMLEGQNVILEAAPGVDLDKYTGQKVTVAGTADKTVEGNATIIKVTSVHPK